MPPGNRLTLEREYDIQLSHSIWEMERRLRRGPTSETFRRTLVETHVQHIRHMEEIAQLPRQQRSQLRLQPRPADSILLLPGEGMSAEELEPLAEAFHKRGLAVLNTSLAFRTLDRPGRSPIYWQACTDEAQNRFDVLTHYSTSISILGVGLAGLIAMHVAATRPVQGVIALYPALDADLTIAEKLRATMRRLFKREEIVPHTWPQQRKAAARTAGAVLTSSPVPLYVLAEDRNDRTDAGRTSQVARKLVSRAATKVRLLRPGEAPTVRDLPPSAFDEILTFLRRR